MLLDLEREYIEREGGREGRGSGREREGGREKKRGGGRKIEERGGRGKDSVSNIYTGVSIG